jgi:hypothetical protein
MLIGKFVSVGTAGVGVVNAHVLPASAVGRGDLDWLNEEFIFVAVAATDDAIGAVAGSIGVCEVSFFSGAPASEGRGDWLDEKLLFITADVATDKDGIRAEVDGTGNGEILLSPVACASEGRVVNDKV